MSKPFLDTDTMAEDIEAEPEVTDGMGTYVPDVTALQRSNGSATAWAHELSELIGHTTGKWISEDTLESWMTEFHRQVVSDTYRRALFQVANTTLPPTAAGDPALLLLTLRDELAAGLKHSAGL